MLKLRSFLAAGAGALFFGLAAGFTFPYWYGVGLALLGTYLAFRLPLRLTALVTAVTVLMGVAYLGAEVAVTGVKSVPSEVIASQRTPGFLDFFKRFENHEDEGVVVEEEDVVLQAVPSTGVPTSFFGMHGSGTPGGAVRLWDADVTWRDLNPAEGVFQFSVLEQRLQENAGKHVTLVLGATPTWAARDPAAPSAPWLGPGTASVPRDIAHWREYVRTVAERFSGEIDTYQVWNEPALTQFWQGTPGELARLTEVAVQEVRSADPQAQVITGGAVPRQRGWRDFQEEFVKEMRSREVEPDGWGVHGYPKKDGGVSQFSELLEEVREVIEEGGYEGADLVVTEMNYAKAPPVNGIPTPELNGVEAAEWVLRTHVAALESGVSQVQWYAWHDVPKHLRISMKEPAVEFAYRTMVGWLSGEEWGGCAPTKGATLCSVGVDTLVLPEDSFTIPESTYAVSLLGLRREGGSAVTTPHLVKGNVTVQL